MKALVFVVVVLLAGIVGLGFYRGWFRLSMVNSDQQPSATVTVDKNKIHEDEQKAKDTVHGFGQGAKDKLGEPVGKGKAPEPQP
jgi:hypothetical protein